MTQTIDIDIRGQICPSCLLLTLKEINRHAAATIPATTERMGFRAEVQRLSAGYRIDITGNP